MESLYLLIPISLVFIAIAIKLFFWAVHSGQYDDLDSEGERILFDQEELSVTGSAQVAIGGSDEQTGPQKNKRDKPL